MVRMRKVLKDWNVKMEEEGKPHMRILMKEKGTHDAEGPAEG